METEKKDTIADNVFRETETGNNVLKENKDNKGDGCRTPHAYRYEMHRSLTITTTTTSVVRKCP